MTQSRSLSNLLPLRILRIVITWSPVWAPLILIWQLTEGGLKPALDERARLRAEAPAVEARHSRSTAGFERLTAQRAAWDDPLFRERVLREKERIAREHEMTGR